MRHILFSIALLVSGVVLKGEEFATTHSLQDAELEFSLPARVAGHPWISWGFAVEILEVRCDNKPLPPVLEVAVAEPDIAVFPDKDRFVIYRCPLRNLACWKNGKVVPNQFQYFSIPPGRDMISIRYRVHDADGNVTGDLVLNSYSKQYLRQRSQASGRLAPP